MEAAHLDPPWANMIESLERQLDSFNPELRRQALSALQQRAEAGEIALARMDSAVNLHVHTSFSYNAYGYSPSKFAWLARKTGLAAGGIVDFDVLDGVDEFMAAGRTIGLKTCASMESRVFVPEFADRVLNSPGEPGIAYHMGVGFPRAVEHPVLAQMRSAASQRTRDMVERVNKFMAPVKLDYERDVIPLTPKGNVTERHLCVAFEQKAAHVFPNDSQRAAYWKEKLGEAPAGPQLQNQLRARTMKKGGVGYVQPGKGSFPLMSDMNQFVLASGAIPTLTWLDGTSEGEKCIDELFAVAIASGAAALNVIPDRNCTPGVKDQKLKNLYEVVELAQKHDFPVLAGTEMNSPGNKFVDSFDTAELAPLAPVFLRSAHIFYAHSVLQRAGGLGYLSSWAKRSFPNTSAKNEFFSSLGRKLDPQREDCLGSLNENTTLETILRAAS
jgi:hypothetical protein